MSFLPGCRSAQFGVELQPWIADESRDPNTSWQPRRTIYWGYLQSRSGQIVIWVMIQCNNPLIKKIPLIKKLMFVEKMYTEPCTGWWYTYPSEK